MGTKVVISPGFGAGWSTWNDKSKEVAEYLPIIEYIEADKPVLSGKSGRSWDNHDWLHPDFLALVKQMEKDLDLDGFYMGGADNLIVVAVDGPYRIDEYDGSERVTTAVDFW